MIAPAGAAGRLLRRAASFFALDDDWERSEGRDLLTRADWVVGVVVAVSGVLLLELYRSVGSLEGVDQPRWVEWTVVAAGALLLVGRRRWPLTVVLLAATHMFVTGVWLSEIMGQVSLQIAYFVAFFSGVAWARSRRDMLLVVVPCCCSWPPGCAGSSRSATGSTTSTPRSVRPVTPVR